MLRINGVRSQFHYNDPTSVRWLVSTRSHRFRCTLHTAFCISPERYLVYISLINYVFNFCAPRFMLVISFLLLVLFVDHHRRRFTWIFFLPNQLKVSSLFRLVSSCLLIGLIYARASIFFFFHSGNERWGRNWCESVLQMSCVACARGITFNQMHRFVYVMLWVGLFAWLGAHVSWLCAAFETHIY